MITKPYLQVTDLVQLLTDENWPEVLWCTKAQYRSLSALAALTETYDARRDACCLVYRGCRIYAQPEPSQQLTIPEDMEW